jgi:hypothetical protein
MMMTDDRNNNLEVCLICYCAVTLIVSVRWTAHYTSAFESYCYTSSVSINKPLVTYFKAIRTHNIFLTSKERAGESVHTIKFSSSEKLPFVLQTFFALVIIYRNVAPPPGYLETYLGLHIKQSFPIRPKLHFVSNISHLKKIRLPNSGVAAYKWTRC